MMPKIQTILYATDLWPNADFVRRYARDTVVNHGFGGQMGGSKIFLDYFTLVP